MMADHVHFQVRLRVKFDSHSSITFIPYPLVIILIYVGMSDVSADVDL